MIHSSAERGSRQREVIEGGEVVSRCMGLHDTQLVHVSV